MTKLFSSTFALALLATIAGIGASPVAYADNTAHAPFSVRCFLGAHGDAAAGGDRSGWTCVPEHRSAQS